MYRRRGGFGRLEERALIFRLLKGRFPNLGTTWFSTKCRGNQARESSWNAALDEHESLKGVRDLQDRFLETLSEGNHLGLPIADAASILVAAEQKRPSQFMGILRTALAKTVLREVRPDIVIFDEFQKFREMLIDPPNVSTDPVAVALRGGGVGDPGVLLLSATPYRLYSTRQEETAGASHHQEFFELIRFLFGPESKQPKEIERVFLDFGGMMLAKETPDFKVLGELCEEIQQRLRGVMSRTERPNAGTSFEANHPPSEIRQEDLRVFRNWVVRLQDGQKADRGKVDLVTFAVPYWLSVPLPIQMLGSGYIAWRRADTRRKRRDEPVFRKAQRDHLEAPKSQTPKPKMRLAGKTG